MGCNGCSIYRVGGPCVADSGCRECYWEKGECYCPECSTARQQKIVTVPKKIPPKKNLSNKERKEEARKNKP